MKEQQQRSHEPSVSPTSRFALRRLLTVVAAGLLLIPIPAQAAQNEFAKAVHQGPLYAAGLALVGGLLVSLTPCVYPMVAITVSVFGAKQSKSRWHGLGLSSAFVAGIIAMFTPMGVIAGMTGSLFGSALQSPWVLSAIAALFLAMSAGMLGAFELSLPSGLTNRLAQVGGVGPRGAFGLGLVCGLIAAPCTGPVLTGILTWIAETQSAVAGGLAMAAFSLGLGLPFFFVGAFAVQLPKGGAWMVHIKSVLAIVLAVVALYYLATAFPLLSAWIKPTASVFFVSSAAIALGLLLGAVHREFSSPEMKDRFLKGFGTLLATGGAFVIVAATLVPERQLDWLRIPLDDARKTAQDEQRPLLVDFTASWCGACKELDKLTFADAEVNREAGRFIAVKVDASDDEDPLVQRTMESLGVVGLPTVVVFDSKGKEVKRFTDFVEASEFLDALAQIH
jgi:thiol:disulfide interchange protein DsbD